MTTLPEPLSNVILYVTIVVSFVAMLVPLLTKLSGLTRKLLVTVIADLAAVREASTKLRRNKASNAPKPEVVTTITATAA